MEAIDNFVRPLAIATGFPVDQLKFVLSLFAAYPLGYIWRKLPSTTAKHIFGIFTGLSILIFCLGPYAWMHSMFTALVTYAALAILPSKVALRFVFVFAFGYMSGSHIYRLWTDYMGWSMDFTGPQMVLTLKLISVAFNVYDAKRKLTSPSLDGITDEKVLADKRRVGKMIDTIAKERAEFALTSMPSVLEYLGFIYFPTSLLAGPVFELAEYRNLANNSIFKTSGFSPSGCATATLLAVCKALVMMGLVMVSGMYPISAISSTEYGTWSVGYRWYFLYVSMALIRCKYYFGWFLSEGACILSGLGYAGVSKEGKNLWNRCQNVSPLMCELPENSRSVSDGWNSSTARWLKRYVYLRVGKVGQPSTMSTYATFIVSAFWHGFYPGYYFSFVSGALFVETSRQLRRDLGPLFDKQGPFYSLRHVFNLGSTLLTVWVFAYMCGPFQLLDAKMAWQLYIDLQFAPHIASVATLLLLSLLRPTLRKMMRARQSPAAAVAAVAGEGSSVPRAVSAS